jgi:VIT1/CCC1 family predicted Fe2+/Mn2+ transporter
MSHYRVSPLALVAIVWIASTFGFGAFLALCAMPRILRACVDGDSKGLAASLLVFLVA